MKTLPELFASNRAWAEKMTRNDPGFFERLSRQQTPEYLWIGCSDSRVPANDVVDVPPGDIFVHRNVANLVVQTDLNCLSVLQFAIDVLRVRHVIVCGHYGCGGINTALDKNPHGLIDNWLRQVQDVHQKYRAELDALDDQSRADRLCELNALEQARNVAHTTIVQEAWARKQPLEIHAWIYQISDGLLHDLGLTLTCDTDYAAMTGNPAAAAPGNG